MEIILYFKIFISSNHLHNQRLYRSSGGPCKNERICISTWHVSLGEIVWKRRRRVLSMGQKLENIYNVIYLCSFCLRNPYAIKFSSLWNTLEGSYNAWATVILLKYILSRLRLLWSGCYIVKRLSGLSIPIFQIPLIFILLVFSKTAQEPSVDSMSCQMFAQNQLEGL